MSLSRIFFIITFIGTAFLSTGLGYSVAEEPRKSLTDLFRPHWPYEAFWAIPKIDSIKPSLVLKTNSKGRIIGRSRCLEIDILEKRRIYDPLAKMNNEQLHRVACKAMKIAIKQIDYLPIYEKLETDEEIHLKFDFSQGVVSSSKKIFQPVQPQPEDTENSG